MSEPEQLGDEPVFDVKGPPGPAVVWRARDGAGHECLAIWFDGVFVQICETEGIAAAIARKLAALEPTPRSPGVP